MKDLFRDLNIKITKDKVYVISGDLVMGKNNTFSHKDLTDFIKQYNFCALYNKQNKDEYSQYYNPAIEFYAMPFINYIFYIYFCINLKVPTLEELTDMYLQKYCKQINTDTYSLNDFFIAHGYNITFKKKHILGRIYRAYFSFIRELDILYKIFDEEIYAYYDFQEDIDGKDITVFLNNKKTYIASFMGTKRSQKYKKRKNNYRHGQEYNQLYQNNNIINAVANKNNCEYINNIMVYKPTYIKNILNEIR